MMERFNVILDVKPQESQYQLQFQQQPQQQQGDQQNWQVQQDNQQQAQLKWDPKVEPRQNGILFTPAGMTWFTLNSNRKYTF